MNNQHLSLYGLKWNPFSPEAPVDSFLCTPPIDAFSWRVEQLAREGGFALVLGDPGVGKSVALRMLVQRFANLHEVKVNTLTRPQCSIADFYRELGARFEVQLAPHNRWGGARVLRERWHAHIEHALYRAVLLVDEAQEMTPGVFNELRLLSSADLDARSLLTVVLCGDGRLSEKLRRAELLPLASRVRVRLNLEAQTPNALRELLLHVLEAAGNPQLMTRGLVTTLCEHAAGNPRILMTLANDLLDAGILRKAKRLDEQLYLDVFAVPSTTPTTKHKTRRAKGARA